MMSYSILFFFAVYIFFYFLSVLVSHKRKRRNRKGREGSDIVKKVNNIPIITTEKTKVQTEKKTRR